jgi:hypothetical protein
VFLHRVAGFAWNPAWLYPVEDKIVVREKREIVKETTFPSVPTGGWSLRREYVPSKWVAVPQGQYFLHYTKPVTIRRLKTEWVTVFAPYLDVHA